MWSTIPTSAATRNFSGAATRRKTRALLVNNQPGRGIFPCFTYRTIADELDAAGVTWHYYAPPAIIGPYGRPLTPFARYVTGPDWENDIVTPPTRVLEDIAHGTLPQVSWVMPTASTSDHAYPRQPRFRNVAISTNKGPDWVASIVNSVGKSKYWKDSAIFVVWDDWGGWYDHVVPPQLDSMGLGFRVPLLVVSPYASTATCRTRNTSSRAFSSSSRGRMASGPWERPTCARTPSPTASTSRKRRARTPRSRRASTRLTSCERLWSRNPLTTISAR